MNLAEIRQNLRDYRLHCEKFRLESYLGRKPAKSLEEIEETSGDLFTASTVESLQNAAENCGGQNETERKGRKALLQISRLGFLKNRTREIAGEIEKCGKSMRIKFQGESLSAAQISEKIKREEKSEIRRELFSRRIEAENSCADLIWEKFAACRENARTLGFIDLRELFEDVAGAGSDSFAAKARSFLENTEDSYFRAFSEICGGAGDLSYADFIFITERIERKDAYTGSLLSFFYARILENFNFSPGKIPQIKLKKTAVFHPTDSFAPNLPEDVFLCFSERDGAENYFRFLHNFGKAQKNAWTSLDLLNRHPEFVFAPDDCLGNAYGFLFQTLLADEGFLRKSFSVTDEKLTGRIIRENKFRLLYAARLEALRFLAESRIYSNENSNFADVLPNAAEDFTGSLGFRFQAEQIIFEITTRDRARKNVRSLLFAYGLREYLRERYDFEWWRARAAFEELIDFWNTAERFPAEEMAGLIGFEMSFDLLAESFL